MNVGTIAYVLGTLLIVIGSSMVFPLACSLYYNEGDFFSILISALITIAMGLPLWWFFRKDTEANIKDGFFVAVLDEYIVGYVIALMEQGSSFSLEKKRVHIMNLAVHPRFRNRGIARNLIYTIISNTKEEGAKEIYLEVRASNQIALAFYRRLEFKRTGLIERFYGDENAIIMTKNLKH